MTDLEINLLSPNKKSKLKGLIKFLFIKEYLELVVLTASILAILHLGAFILLTGVVDDLSSSSLLVNKDFSSLNQNIRTINSLLKSVSTAGQEFTPVTPWFFELAAILPPDIRLTNVVISRIDGTVLITGIATTRDSLLAFQKSIGTLTWLKAASIPRSQLFQKDDVAFEITATLTKTLPKERKTPPPVLKEQKD